ncbi:hypothetical protein [Paenibacillus tyrfis]|uniref:hypothetical protein n=1 Tax=Paenibacillus tyrfis TaxID=1501230 RepID=UPI00209E4393|nr:hypothetical protein [Paenibacillus tyrfis]MCP1306412.1 hypothetical protein [Paenibacillus tyrfis]
MEQKIQFSRGDSVKFGQEWCKEHRCEHLSGKTIMMTPQWFEYDDDFGGGYQECPGMIVEDGQEPDSIYHLFGNDFENFMDCEHIKGTDEDKAAYMKIIKEAEEAEAKAWDSFASSCNYKE